MSFNIQDLSKPAQLLFKAGLSILKEYEPNPEINDMGGGEYYVGNMCLWENSMPNYVVQELQKYGFHWYESAECLLFEDSFEEEF